MFSVCVSRKNRFFHTFQLPNLGSPSANCAKIAILTANRMARMARVVAAGVPHHITQRGNNRQDVFLLDDDRRFYL